MVYRECILLVNKNILLCQLVKLYIMSVNLLSYTILPPCLIIFSSNAQINSKCNKKWE